MSRMYSSSENPINFAKKELLDMSSQVEEEILGKNGEKIKKKMEKITQFLSQNQATDHDLNILCEIVAVFWSYEKIAEVTTILTCIEETQHTIRSLTPSKNNFIVGKIKFCKGCMEAYNGNFQQALLVFQELIPIIQDKNLLALIMINSGIIHTISGDNEKAIEIYNECLQLFEELNDSIGISLIYNHLGILDINSGKYDEAMIYFRKSMGIREEQNVKVLLIPAYNNVGEVYRTWGEMDTALTFYQKGLKLSQHYENHKKILVGELKNYEWILEPWSFGAINIIKAMENQKSILLFNLGLIYQSKGDYSQAFSNFQQTLTLDEKVGEEQSSVETLFQLIFLTCENGYYNEAIVYFREIEKLYIHNKNNSNIISQYYLVSNALILRSKENIKAFAESLDILEEIRSQDIISLDLKRYALTFLMEAYLTELKLFNNPKIFKKAYDLASDIEQLAWEEKSTILLLYMKQIKAKLAFIQENFSKFREYLEIGFQTAQNMKFWSFAGYFHHELQYLDQMEQKWQTQDKPKLSFKERIEIAKLDLIISHISRNQIVNITQFPAYALNEIRSVLFKMADVGPIPVIAEPLSDFLSKENTQTELNQVLLQKLALFYTVALGQGNSPNYGLYGPLPIPDYPGYVALAYSFKISDRNAKDHRMKGTTFAILSFLIPEAFIPFFTERPQIVEYLDHFILKLSDISDITMEWFHTVKQKIIELQ